MGIYVLGKTNPWLCDLCNSYTQGWSDDRTRITTCHRQDKSNLYGKTKLLDFPLTYILGIGKTLSMAKQTWFHQHSTHLSKTKKLFKLFNIRFMFNHSFTTLYTEHKLPESLALSISTSIYCKKNETHLDGSFLIVFQQISVEVPCAQAWTVTLFHHIL